MTRIAFLALFLTAAATGGVAQEVTVRSGEHDGYTRLVAQVPQGTEWAVTQTKNGARLQVALDDVVFQTGSIFQRLTQNRLAAVSQVNPGAALEMEFGCDCAASAFLFKDTMIVVDIAPGTALPPISKDIPPLTLPKAARVEKPLIPTHPLDPLTLPLLGLNARGFEEQLSTRLLQGADRDIVDLNIAPAGPRASVDDHSLFIPPGAELNINVTSVLDDLNGLLGPDIPQLEKRPPCVSSAELGFDKWTDNRPFLEQVSALRSGLFHEFDTIDKARALQLAKLYAYSGFGAEALRALDLLKVQSEDTSRVAAIAQILDDTRLTAPNPFAGLQRCESDSALWATLTEGHLQEDANLTAIEQSFARLPDHLRRYIGPTLAEILVNRQEIEAARRVLRSVDRVETQTSPSAVQAKAKVATAEGDAPRTEALLKEVITTSDAALEAPLALARLVDKRWLDRGAVSPQELGLAASYTVEFRRSEIGPQMLRTHAVALSLANEHDAALNLAGELPENADSAETLNRVMLVLTERADDTTFLRRALSLPKKHIQGLTTDTAIAVADRLASLGFSKSVLKLARRPQDKLRRGARARLRARAALLDQRPHQAMLELADDPSDKAVQLRATAMQAVGDFRAAGDLMRITGDPDAANRLFWLADLPDEADPNTDTKFSQVVQATQSLSRAPSRQAQKPLADAASLLQDSADTRQRIGELLATLGQE
ncbi:hypothetical protein [Ruegeria halocynthiae]|uniref:hypothetical protein n=1 Tax=Ruegeria halocynthiae TaxID=985054 RepID=UPI00068A4747|nr:hypothetical protein [Ruegeria halocynthiae]